MLTKERLNLSSRVAVSEHATGSSKVVKTSFIGVLVVLGAEDSALNNRTSAGVPLEQLQRSSVLRETKATILAREKATKVTKCVREAGTAGALSD